MLFTHNHLLFYCVVFLNNQRRHPEVMSLLATTILSLSLSSLNCYQTNFHHRQLRLCRLAGRASIFLTFAARSSQRSIICVGKNGGSCDHRGIRHRVLTNQRDRSYVYAVVSLAAGGPFVGGPIVTYIFSRVEV